MDNPYHLRNQTVLDIKTVKAESQTQSLKQHTLSPLSLSLRTETKKEGIEIRFCWQYREREREMDNCMAL